MYSESDDAKRDIPVEAPPEGTQSPLIRKLLPRLDEDDESRLAFLVSSNYWAAKTDRREWESRLAEWEAAYYNKVSDKIFPWEGCSNFHVPITMMDVETFKPRLVEGVIGQDPPVMLVPSSEAIDQRKDTTEAFLNWQVKTQLDGPNGKHDALAALVMQSAHLFLQPGMAIAKTYWKVDRVRHKFVREFPLDTPPDQIMAGIFGIEEPINVTSVGEMTWTAIIPTTPQGGAAQECRWEILTIEDPDQGPPRLQVLVERDEVIEGPQIDLIDPIDIFAPIKGGGDPQKLPWIIHRLWMDQDTLRKKARQGRFYADAVQLVIDSGPPRGDQPLTDSQAYRASLDQTEGVTGWGPSNVRRDQWEILECYRRYDIDEDGFDEEIIVWVAPRVSEGKMLGWDYLDNVYGHGRRPFHVGRYQPIPFRWFGLSLAEVIKGIQDEINAIHNQRVDYATLQNMPFFVKRASSTLPNITQKLIPGQGLEVDNPQTDIVFPKFQGEPAWGQQEEAILMQYNERLTGLTDLAIGRQPNRVGATRTAAGTQTLLSEAGLRFKGAMTAFQGFWQGIFADVLALDQEYLPPGTEFRITGKRPGVVKITDRSEIRGQYNIRLVSTTEAMNRQNARQDATVIFQATLNPALIQAGLIGKKGIQRALADFYRAYSKEPDLYMEPQGPILTPEEELIKFKGGEYVSPVMGENLQQHIQAHEAAIQDPNILPETKKLIAQHLQETLQLAQMVQMVQSLQQNAPNIPGPQQAMAAQQGRQAPQPNQAPGKGPAQPAPKAAGPVGMPGPMAPRGAPQPI